MAGYWSFHFFLLFSLRFSSVSLNPSLTHHLPLLSFSRRKQSNTHMCPHPIFFSQFAQNTLHRAIYPSPSSATHTTRVCTCMHTYSFFPFSKLDAIKFVFISSLQTGLNLNRRNHIPACCVKLYELMKSAGWLVRDLVWGNSAPLVLYTDAGGAVFSGLLQKRKQRKANL